MLHESEKERGGPETWLQDHGDVLYNHALLRVRKAEVAEDLVQETLLAAIRAYDKFEPRASVRSWLRGILNHKIIDHYRKLARETSLPDTNFLRDELAGKFTANGLWRHDQVPKEWRPASDEVAHRDEFWQTLEFCLMKLPQRIADAFMLREIDELATKDICRMLGISEGNLWVMLHRARMALRECLEMNWFSEAVIARR